MKTVKVVIILLVMTSIAYFVVKSVISTGPPTENTKDTTNNPHIEKIRRDIELLIKKSDQEFCVDIYEAIHYDIEDNHRSNRLGATSHENDQWQDILYKQLYAAYAEKFIKQSFYVFEQSGWSDLDLQIIRSQTDLLQKDTLLQRSTPIDISLNQIRAILSKYDEIKMFIEECRLFNLDKLGLEDTFPIDDVRLKIARSKGYLQNSMDNPYINNCLQLKNELNSVPDIMLEAHSNYLSAKILKWTGAYKGLLSQKNYNNDIWLPIKRQIDELEKGPYNSSILNDNLAMLRQKWDIEAAEAYNHYTN